MHKESSFLLFCKAIFEFSSYLSSSFEIISHPYIFFLRKNSSINLSTNFSKPLYHFLLTFDKKKPLFFSHILLLHSSSHFLLNHFYLPLLKELALLLIVHLLYLPNNLIHRMLHVSNIVYKNTYF